MRGLRRMVYLPGLLMAMLAGQSSAAGPTAANSTNSMPVLSQGWGLNLPYADPDGGTMTFTMLSSPARGSLEYFDRGGMAPVIQGVPVSSASWSYNSTGTATGTDSFAWQVCDGTYTSGVATVTIVLTTNSAISSTSATNTTAVGAVRYGIYLYCQDPDWAQTKSVQLVVPPGRGLLEYDASGGGGGMTALSAWTTIASNDWVHSTSWVYTPSGANAGTDTFQWRVTDGVSTSAVATMTLIIDGNAPPFAINQSATNVVGAVRFPIYLSMIHSNYGQPMAFQLLSPPGRGLLEYLSGSTYIAIASNDWVSSQSWRYTQSGAAAGPDSFSWRVTDGMVTSGSATVSLTLNANSAPAANAMSQTFLTNAVRKYINLSITHDIDDAYQPVTFRLTAPPAHGILEYFNGTNYVNVPSNTPIVNNDWYYTSVPASYSGADSFQWKVSDSISTSAAATCSFNITTNRAPVAQLIRTTTLPGSNITFNARYTDQDSGQSWSAGIVQAPAHGTLTVQGLNFSYTPANGFEGVDSFQYSVSDSVCDSAPAQGFVQVRQAGDRAGSLVLLVVNDLMMSVLSNEIVRLSTDLQNEGYTSKIKTWNISTNGGASNLWSYLHSEYYNTNQFLQGAILIGDVPKAQTYEYHSYFSAYRWQYTDLIYWNMAAYQTNDQITTWNIWVSRINADDTAWGSQSTLIRRALDANHAYRTGASRLPHTTYVFDCFTTSPYTNTMLDVWPAVRAGGGGDHSATFKFLPSRTDVPYAACDSFVAGGEVFNETSHGNANGYMEGSWFDKNALYKVIAQQRVLMCGSCTSGEFGGIANNHLFTRGGGLVLAVGGTDINYSGDFQINGWGNQVGCRKRLAAGDSWGGACLVSYPFNTGCGARIVFYGDFSLGVMPAPSNSMPVIASLASSPAAPATGEPVTFTVAYSDPDAGATNSPFVDYQHQAEWFPEGYNYGRATPACVTNNNGGAGWTNFVHVYTNAGTYTVRVEVMDEWQARVWKEKTITVNTRPVASNDAASVVAGYAVSIPVLSNDYDPDGQAISIQSRTVPMHGTATISGGSVIYSSTNAWQGVDTFKYVIVDSMSAVATGTVDVTVYYDTVAPVLTDLTCTETNVMNVKFSKLLDPVTAQNPANYALNHGATVLSAVLCPDGRTVRLLTSALSDGVLYTLTVSGVKDSLLFAANTIAAGSAREVVCRQVSGYAMNIGFAGYNRAEMLTNFPVMIVLSNNMAGSGFAYDQFASTNGYDLRFTSADQSMELPYEIEKWVTNGSSVVWVKLPVLTAGVTIRAGWGNPKLATAAAAYTTNGTVWASGYAAVWHLGELVGNRYDSTTNRVAGVPVNTPVARSGVAADCIQFTGTSLLDAGNVMPLRITGSQTIEMWLKPQDFTTRRNPFAKAYGGEGAITIETNGSLTYFYGTTGDNTGTSGATPGYQGLGTGTNQLSTTAWSHVTVIRDLGSMQLIWLRDGVSVTNAAALYTAATASSLNATIGTNYAGGYRGYLDELRISSVARSTNWIWAGWLNMASNAVFCQYGAAQSTANTNVDASGIPDAWKILYYGSTNAAGSGALADFDGDGMNNLSEWLAGTDPTNTASRLAFTSIVRQSADGVGLDFDSVAGQTYSVYSKTNLTGPAGWLFFTNFQSQGGQLHISCTNSLPQGYFQIRVTP